MRPERGVANTIVALLALTAIALSLPTIFFYTYTNKVRQEMGAFGYLEIDEKAKYVEVNVVAVINNDVLSVVVRNGGGKEMEIEGIFALSKCGTVGTVVKLTGSRYTLPPGTYHQLSVSLAGLRCSSPSIGGVYVVTSEPRVYSAKLYNMTLVAELGPVSEEVGALSSVVHVLFPMEVRGNPWDAERVLKGAGFAAAKPDNPYGPSKLDLLSDFSVLARGMRSASGRWIMPEPNNFSNAGVLANNIEVRNVFLGYDPVDPSKYVMLITNDGGVELTIDGTRWPFCSGYLASRVKVYGFRSDRAEGVIYIVGDSSRFMSGKWIDRPDQDVAEYTFLNLNNRGRVYFSGRADRVEVYCFKQEQQKDSSYLPYLVFTKTVGGSPKAGLLFTTIDAVYGSAGSRNDRPGTVPLQDYSVEPLALVYRGLAIDNNNTRAVLLMLNYRFHDNEGSDFSGVTVDRPIIILGIVDEGGKVVSYRSFTFRELTRYEDTYPPTAQAQSSLVFIPLPSKETVGIKNFYVFIILQDPYLFNSDNVNLDDVDITLYVESLTVLLYE